MMSHRGSDKKYTTAAGTESFAQTLQRDAETRMALRLDASVVDELQRWWHVARAGTEQQRSMNALLGTDDADPDGLGESQFVLMSMLICKALMPQYDEDAAMQLAMDEWQQEAGDAESLHRERVMDAVFTVADLWTAGTSGAEYAGFLRNLWDQVATGEPPDECFFKQEQEVQYWPEAQGGGDGGDVGGGGGDEALRSQPTARQKLRHKLKSAMNTSLAVASMRSMGKPASLAEAIAAHEPDGKRLKQITFKRSDLAQLTAVLVKSKSKFRPRRRGLAARFGKMFSRLKFSRLLSRKKTDRQVAPADSPADSVSRATQSGGGSSGDGFGRRGTRGSPSMAPSRGSPSMGPLKRQQLRGSPAGPGTGAGSPEPS